MKMKNTLLLCLILSHVFACNANSSMLTEDINKLEVTDSLDALLADDITPLESSVQNLRDFFASLDVGVVTLKNRQSIPTSKTTRFNEAFLEYIKQVYNQRAYATHLSQNGSHVVEFLELGHELNLNAEYLYVGTRLFYNKLKEAEIINDTVSLQLLPAFTKYLTSHFEQQDEDYKPKENVEFLKRHTEEVILYKFTEHFNTFQTNPDSFIDELAHDLATFYQHQEDTKEQLRIKRNNKQETLMRLRQMVIRFFELVISKTMWNTFQPETIWTSFTVLANGFQNLAQSHILDHMDDLDDLLWSLVHRFNYYIELTGADLPIEFYEKIENDLINRKVFFLEAKEQDEGIASKKQVLIEGLLRGKARAIAEKEGLLTRPMR
ncbi:hypothetical protein FJ364_01415 [Candidatus Dependentiae bacterium]|nr:hypothetical protein [Candidatus Dependentiae bacterium]